MRIFIPTTVLLAGLMLSGGCVDPQGHGKGSTAYDKLAGELAQSQSINQQQQARIDQLQQELDTLRGMPADRLEQLVQVAGISLGRFSRGHDQDKDGIDDGLTVHVVVRDRAGDVIKATGAIEIKVLDPAAASGQVELGVWSFSPGEVAQHWLGGFGTNYYKFQLPWPAGHTPKHGDLTVWARFSDVLTGRSFENQRVVAVSVGPSGQ